MRLLPFFFVIMLGALLFMLLAGPPQPSNRASPMVGQNAPAELQRGELIVVNIFASWCAPCIAEMPELAQLQQALSAPIIGLNYKDKPDARAVFLAKYGNPFDEIVVDEHGKIGIGLGMSGVPETWVIDAKGIIRWHYAGVLTQQQVQGLAQMVAIWR